MNENGVGSARSRSIETHLATDGGAYAFVYFCIVEQDRAGASGRPLHPTAAAIEPLGDPVLAGGHGGLNGSIARHRRTATGKPREILLRQPTAQRRSQYVVTAALGGFALVP
jgi:hypothetical protein